MSARTKAVVLARLSGFFGSRDGAMAPVFAVVGLMLVIALGGSIDVGRVMSARDQLQDIADSAALAGATQMGTSGSPTTSAQNFVKAAVTTLPGKPTVTGTYTYDSTAQTVTVALQEAVATTFGALMTPSVTTNVSSTATGTIARQVTISLKNFSSSAADLNQIFVYTYPTSLSGTALYNYTPTLPSSSVFSDAGSNASSVTTTVPVGYMVGFALSNTTGGKSGYGSNCYGQAQGVTHIYYSHREDSSGSYWDPSATSFNACTNGGSGNYWSAQLSSGTPGWYYIAPCNSSDAYLIQLIGGSCSSSVTYPGGNYVYYTDENASYKAYDPLWGTPYNRNPLKFGTSNTDCTKGDVTLDWDDNGGTSDDNDYNDAVFTANCTQLVVQQSSIRLLK